MIENDLKRYRLKYIFVNTQNNEENPLSYEFDADNDADAKAYVENFTDQEVNMGYIIINIKLEQVLGQQVREITL